jgi:hypothetical protein
MRWFLVVYVLFCWVLFFSAFFFLKGYEFDGPPYGTFLLARDIAGFNFRSVEELTEASLELFDNQSFRVGIEDKKYHLKAGRHFFVRVDRERLLGEYRRFCRELSWYKRLKEFVFLDYPKRDFPFAYELDRERSREVIERVFREEIQFSYRVSPERGLIRDSLTIDIDELINKISQSLAAGSRRSVDFEISSVEKEEVLRTDNIFPYLVSEEKMKWASSERGFDITSDFVSLFAGGLLLNPGESFSLKTEVEKLLDEADLNTEKPLDSSASENQIPVVSEEDSVISSDKFLFEEELSGSEKLYGKKRFHYDDLVLDDCYGFSRFASGLFKIFLKTGLRIVEHNHFRYYISELSWFSPGLDVSLGDGQDFRVSNNKNYPLYFVMSYEDEFWVIRAWSALESESSFDLLESARRIVPAYTQTLPDSELEKGEQRIEKKAIPGLSVSIRRIEQIPSRESRSTVVWQARYARRNGLVYVAQEDLNIYEGEWGIIDEDEPEFTE